MAYEPSNPDPKRADFRKLQKEEERGIFSGHGRKLKVELLEPKGTFARERKQNNNKLLSCKDACVANAARKLNVKLEKRSMAAYSTADDKIRLTCTVSKEYAWSGNRGYWYAFLPRQKEFLCQRENSYVVFGCGSEKTVILIQFKVFEAWLDKMNVTKRQDGTCYWHVHILRLKEGKYFLLLKGKQQRIDLSEYLLTKSQ
jgi:hypothetical protein